MKIVPSLSSDSMGTGSSAKPHFRLYITVATAIFQPIIIYWLTSHLVRWLWGPWFPKEKKKGNVFECLYTCVFLKCFHWNLCTVVNCSVCWMYVKLWFHWFNHNRCHKIWSCCFLLWEMWINSIFGHPNLTKKGAFIVKLVPRIQLNFIFYAMYLDGLYLWKYFHVTFQLMLINDPSSCKFCILFIYHWQLFLLVKYIKFCAFSLISFCFPF